VGFVMPAIPDSFYIDLTTVKGISRTTAEFQHLLNPPSVLTARGITITDAQRYALLREVAKALAFLHRIGVCVGDISPKNLLFSLHPRPAVYFIDCDAMRINGVSVLPQVETPEWEVPAGEELATIHSDTYKLGLLALRLLARDQNTKDIQQLPSTTPKPLRQLITDTLTNKPERRPLPEAWTYLLGHTLEEVQHRAPTPPTPTPLKPAPPTHSPEPQPVVRSRPTTTAEKRIAAKVGMSPIPASAPSGTSSNPKTLWAILGVAAAGFLLLVVLIALAISSSGGSSQSTSRTTTASPTDTTTGTATRDAVAPAAPPEVAAPAPPTSGPVSYGGLTCSSGAALWLSTAKSVVLICDQGGGTYVYKGLRLSDGAGIQIAGVVRTAEGFRVTNEGTRYDVGLDGLVIQTPDGEVYSEPAVASGS
jgi:eukaryotic-like serine/threonine-protein kinase